MRNKISYILFLLASVIAYGQISFRASSDKSDYDAGDIINIIVVLETNGVPIYEQSLLKLPDLANKFTVLGSGSNNRSFVDPASNTIITQTVYKIALEAKQKGKMRLGSFLIDINDRRYKTEPFNIFIKDTERRAPMAKTTSNEVYLNVDVEDKSIYVNEPTIAVLRAYSKNIDNLRKVKNIRLPEQSNVNTKMISMQKSEIDPSGYDDMPTQVLAVFMVFPNELGNVEVHPVSATLGNNSKKSIHSNRVKLNVKKLPHTAPENYNNAVGKFNVSISASNKEKLEVEKPMNVTVKISGDGNFETMALPKIAASPDYDFFTPKIVSHVKASRTGNVGEVVANYILIPKRVGEFAIKTEGFTYFNPEEEKYEELESQFLNVNVLSHAQVVDAQSTLEKVNEYTNTVLETVNTPILKTSALKVKEKDKINWNTMWVNGALLFAALIGFLGYRKWRRTSNENKIKNAPKPLGSVAETESEIRKNLKTDLSDYFHYLQDLKSKNDFAGFFNAYSELDAETRKQKGSKTDSEFYFYLRENKGSDILEKYKVLSQKVQIEKYAPQATSDSLQNLYDEIVEIYSKIIK